MKRKEVKENDLKDLTNLDWLEKKEDRSLMLNIIFNTFHRILDTVLVSVRLSQLLITVCFIQLVFLICDDTNKELSALMTPELLYILKFPTVFQYFSDLHYSLTIVASIPVLIFLVASIWIFLKIYGLSEAVHKEYDQLKQVFGVMLYLFDTVLFIPFFGLVLQNMRCGDSERLLACSSTFHVVKTIVAAMVILLMLAIQVLVAMFFFNFDFKMRDSLARSYNIMHLIFRLYCLVGVALEVFVAKTDSILTAIYVYHFVFATVFCIDYYNRLPYYNTQVSEFYCTFVFGFFWVCLVVLMTNLIAYPMLSDNMLYMILIGLCFFLYLVRTFRAYLYRNLLVKEIEDIDNEIHLDIRFRYIMMLNKSAEVSSQDELLLTSVIRVHFDQCKNIECICKQRADLFDPKKREDADPGIPLFKDKVFIKNYLLLLIRESCRKMPKSSLLNIDLFLFLFKEMNNVPLVNYNIQQFQKQAQNSLFLTVKYAIYRLKISIYYFIKNQNKKELIHRIRIESLRSYDEKMTLLHKQSVKIIEMYGRMWDILGDIIPNIALLEIACRNLTNERDEAERIYKQILRINNTSLNFYTLMTIYSKFIAFDDLLKMELEDRMKLSREHYQQVLGDDIPLIEYVDYLTNKEETCCGISVSFDLESIGQIIWASANCTQVFGYENNYFKTLNIAHIMPGIVAKRHHSFLIKFFHKGKVSFLDQLNHLWAVDKERNLFSAIIIIKPFVFSEGLSVIGMIRKGNEKDLLLTSIKGRMDSMGTAIKSLIKLPQIFYEKGMTLNILTLAPKLIPLYLDTIYNIKNYSFEVPQSDETKGLQDFIQILEKGFYIIIEKETEKKLQLLSERFNIIKSDSDEVFDRETYYHEVYNYLSGIKRENIVQVYLFQGRIRKVSFSDGLSLIEFKKIQVREVVPSSISEERLQEEMCFLSRIDLRNPDLKKSISDYIKKQDGALDQEENLINELDKIRKDIPESGFGGLLGNLKKGSKLSKGSIQDLGGLQSPEKLKPKSSVGRGLLDSLMPKNSEKSSDQEPSQGLKLKPSILSKQTSIAEEIPKESGVKPSPFGAGMKTGLGIGKLNKGVGLDRLREKMKEGMTATANKDLNSDQDINIFLMPALFDKTLKRVDKIAKHDMGLNEDNIYEETFLEIEGFDHNSEEEKKVNKAESRIAKLMTKQKKATKDNIAEDMGSVGSNMTSNMTFGVSLKKIKYNINAKSAPMNLKLAAVIVSIGLILSASVNLLGTLLENSVIQECSRFSSDVNSINKMILTYNKLASYIQYNLIQANFSSSNQYERLWTANNSLSLDQEYPNHLTDFNRLIKKVYEAKETTQLDEWIQDFWIKRHWFSFVDGAKNIPLNVYLHFCQNFLRDFKDTGRLTLQSRQFNEEETSQSLILQANTEAFLLIGLETLQANTRIAETLVGSLGSIWLWESIVRGVLLLIALLLASPMCLYSMQKSGKILEMISRITVVNIQFYNNHYNKLTLLMNNNLPYYQILEEVSTSYAAGFRQKLEKEKRNVLNRRIKAFKLSRKRELIWFTFSFFLFLAIFALQSSKSITFYLSFVQFRSSLSAIINTPKFVVSYSAIDIQSLRMFSAILDQQPYQHMRPTLEKYIDLARDTRVFLGQSKNYIIDQTFGDIYNKLFYNDICASNLSGLSTICPKNVALYAKNGLRAFFSFYETAALSKRAYLAAGIDRTLAKQVLRDDIFEDSLSMLSYFEKANEIWVEGLMQQSSLIVDSSKSLSGYLCAAEIALLIILVAVTIFYVYPHMKDRVLYSLSYLLLIPFHIYKENETFSAFLKKEVKLSGMI